MKTKLGNLALATVGLAAVLLGGCVSSKKYKSSQASVQQLRDDSARQAQQIASLNQNVQSLQTKNSDLQHSLDASNSNYANSQKTVTNYENYFKQQQGTMSQVSDQLKNSLTQAGLSDADVQQGDNAIYVRLDEDKVFKRNSAVVTSSGKQALNSVAQVIKERSDVNVFVSNGDSTGGYDASASATGATGTENSNMSTASGESYHHAAKHRTHYGTSHHSSAINGQNAGSASAANTSSAQPQAKSQGATANNTESAPHKKVYHKHRGTEGSMTIYNSSRKYPMSSYWALKQARMGTVANEFLQNGIPKVNVSLEKPNGNSQNKNIKVIITPMMTQFNPEKPTAAN
jgi:hypothetical protein